MFRKTRVRDVPRAKEACLIRADSQKAGASHLRGPYLGEIRSVHGRPSTELVGIGLSMSILPESFDHFAFLGRVGVPDPAGVSK